MINVVYKRTIICDICGIANIDEIPISAILDAGAAPPLPIGWTNSNVTICPVCVALTKKR